MFSILCALVSLYYGLLSLPFKKHSSKVVLVWTGLYTWSWGRAFSYEIKINISVTYIKPPFYSQNYVKSHLPVDKTAFAEPFLSPESYFLFTLLGNIGIVFKNLLFQCHMQEKPVILFAVGGLVRYADFFFAVYLNKHYGMYWFFYCLKNGYICSTAQLKYGFY